MFAQLLLSAVQGACTLELQNLLLKFRELNGEEKYLQLESSIKNSFLLLKTVTDKTKTKIDDTVVNIVLNAVG